MTGPAHDPSPPREPSIEELFAQYLEQPADAREAWLDHACRGDPARMALIRHLAGFARTPSTQPEAVSDDLAPDAIPGLRLRGSLGAGAMGDVLLAYEEEPGRLVAVKVLRRLGTASGLLDRFRREITALATLDDPGIVRILRSGVLETNDGVRPWFSMELVRDARPITAAARAQSWPHTRCIRAVRDAARALHGAHARGLIHGDLSPANVLIDAEGRVRLIDFGIARWVAEAGATTPLATLTVAAPEQARGERVDHRSDVHALGALLAWITTANHHAELLTAACSPQPRPSPTNPTCWRSSRGRPAPIQPNATPRRRTLPTILMRFSSTAHLRGAANPRGSGFDGCGDRIHALWPTVRGSSPR